MSKTRWMFLRNPSSEVMTALRETAGGNIEISGTQEQIGQAIADLDPMPWDVEHSLAEAWASMDGRMGLFHLCRVDRVSEDRMGRYEGYLADAGSMIERARARSLIVTNVWALRMIVLLVLLTGVGIGYLI